MANPNVICISIDSLRADFCSFMGSDDVTTPFLDGVSTNGTVFPKTLTPSTWTLPVHASIFTGLFPPEHGINSKGNVLGDHPTFATLLKKEGYSTKAIYDNGWLSTADILRGFDSINAENNTESEKQYSDNTDQSLSLKAQGADLAGRVNPKIEKLLENSYISYRMAQDPFPEYQSTRDYQTIQSATTEIENQSSPFCWFIHLNSAHWLYTPPKQFLTQFTDRKYHSLVKNYALWQRRIYYDRESRIKSCTGGVSPPKSEVQQFKALYKSCILYCDRLIRDLVNKLIDVGKWENTVLIIFGDHGDAFGENGIFGHHFSVDESITHVPLLIRDPTGYLPAKDYNKPVSLVDLYPLILNLTGTSHPNTNAKDPTKESRKFTYVYYDDSDLGVYRDTINKLDIPEEMIPNMKQYMIWENKDRKLIWNPETGDFSGPESEDTVLREQLQSHTDKMSRLEYEHESIGEDALDNLRNMGYLR